MFHAFKAELHAARFVAFLSTEALPAPNWNPVSPVKSHLRNLSSSKRHIHICQVAVDIGVAGSPRART